MSDEPSQSVNPITLDGAWFRRERERIAVGRRKVAEHLHVTERQLALVETRKLAIPLSWFPFITELGFSVPTASSLTSMPCDETSPLQASSAAPANTATATDSVADAAPISAQQPSSSEAASGITPVFKVPAPEWATPKRRARRSARSVFLKQTEPTQTKGAEHLVAAEVSHGLTGAWLRQQRQRLGFSQSKLGQKLGATQTELSRYERKGTALPANWLSTLKRLGFLHAKPRPATLKRKLFELLTRVAPKPVPAPSQAWVAPQQQQPARPSVAPASPAASAELAQLIIQYRLKLGLRIGQSPVEVLKWIAHDLQVAGTEQVFTYDALRATLKHLLPKNRR